ncbi:MBL fold metallo-hydrolase [Halovulum dunhuangense]|uniref:MBL fold metallo-hydrolase n=1 Tax=Halovulum dunhuangense TaxID=1505036 RepID=A0A849L6X5_9RHOB|nr:MBL fold metallo-hydrolase [Halovulum dunhuangense]NNU81821.1 MBL fold metallo-hydrolase [Halovulum dunhuangense]
MPRLTALSGFDAKGPACFLLEIGGRRLLLDLGEGPDHAARPDLSGQAPVDAILVTHAHADHAGALDMAGQLGDPPVHATAPAIALAPRLAGARELPLGASVIAGIPVETGLAGHAPGAVWLRIGGPGGLVYTGDTNAEGGLFPCTPPPPAAALVFDASYGADDAGLADQRAALQALAARGPLLLPAPAGGRGLEMALAFLEAGHEVALCPAHLSAAARLAGFGPWLAPGGAGRLARLAAKARPLEIGTPAAGVMIAAGPNAETGFVAALVGRGDARIVFTGHLGQGTPAADLVAGGRARFLRWNVHPRLSDQAAILKAVAPRTALPAFLGPGGRRALAGALPGAPLSETDVLAW